LECFGDISVYVIFGKSKLLPLQCQKFLGLIKFP